MHDSERRLFAEMIRASHASVVQQAVEPQVIQRSLKWGGPAQRCCSALRRGKGCQRTRDGRRPSKASHAVANFAAWVAEAWQLAGPGGPGRKVP